MSDDYLWDRSGLPEPDELELETLLGSLRYSGTGTPKLQAVPPGGGSPDSRRTQPQRWRVPLIAGVMAAAAAAGWVLSRPPVAQIKAEAPARSTEAPRPDGALAAPAGALTAESRRPATSTAPTAGSEPSQAALPTAAPGLPPAPSALTTADSDPGGLSVQEISAGVARHRRNLATHCWQPALPRRQPGAPSTVRLAVRFEVLPSGKVTDVSLGEVPRGYPGLGDCVLRQVAGWSFPTAGNSTQVQVPLVFSVR